LNIYIALLQDISSGRSYTGSGYRYRNNFFYQNACIHATLTCKRNLR